MNVNWNCVSLSYFFQSVKEIQLFSHQYFEIWLNVVTVFFILFFLLFLFCYLLKTLIQMFFLYFSTSLISCLYAMPELCCQWHAVIGCVVIYIKPHGRTRCSNWRRVSTETNPEWEWSSCETPSVFTIVQTKTILSGIISIVSDLRDVFLKCLVLLTTMMSHDIPFWARSWRRAMINFMFSVIDVCSVFLHEVQMKGVWSEW